MGSFANVRRSPPRSEHALVDREGEPSHLTGMARRPRPKLVTLSDAAAERVREIMEEKGAGYLRVGVKNGGCAGMEYTMDLVDVIGDSDEVIETYGAKIIIAPTAQMFLFGTEIDYETGLLESGFKFNNPNVSESCGCGESIKFNSQ